jgi:hypothetical protein
MSQIARQQFRLLCNAYESASYFRIGSRLSSCTVKNDSQHTESRITSKIKKRRSVIPERQHNQERTEYIYIARKEHENKTSKYKEKKLMIDATNLKYFQSMLHKEIDGCTVQRAFSVTIHDME